MPELPEVETVKRDLSKVLIGKKISRVEVRKKKIVRGDSRRFSRALTGQKFTSVSRVGKLLIFGLSSGRFLLIHLKMTGQLIFEQGRKIVAGGHKISDSDLTGLPNKYTHIIFSLSGHSHLFFNDLRQFGYLKIVGHKEKEKIISQYGLDPLAKSFTRANFFSLLQNKKSKIKTLLLNQNIIAGIGNIYADEVLFESGVRPNRPAFSLTIPEKEKIFRHIITILKKSIKYKGTTFRDFRGGNGRPGGFAKFLKVYQKEKGTCPRCHQAKISKIIVSGRGPRFCPHCQS